jgi:hypothetical protein
MSIMTRQQRVPVLISSGLEPNLRRRDHLEMTRHLLWYYTGDQKPKTYYYDDFRKGTLENSLVIGVPAG